jgi:hypothetical protein
LCASFDRKVGGVHHLFPFGGFVGEKLAEIAGRARDRNAAEVLEPGLNAGILERQVDAGAQIGVFLVRRGNLQLGGRNIRAFAI